MVTREFLLSRAAQGNVMALPTRYPRAGFYPNEWRVQFDSALREHRIELSRLVQRS